MTGVVFAQYRDEDYLAVCDFLIELNRRDRAHINWNWARFEWMIEHPEFDKSARSAFGLWRSGERIVGAAIYDMYFGEAFCGVLPGFEALYGEVLDYACRELKDDSGLGIAVCDDCAWEISALTKAGFRRAEQTETIMARRLDSIPSPVLPAGLSLREIDHASDADGLALQWLLWQGFDHGDDYAEFERSLPDKRLSLAAVDDRGEGAAYCCLWYMPGTDYAYVEPVAAIPVWRGKGVAKALLYEAMRRAHALGAERAYVISDQVFYQKIGFETDKHFTFYWKA